MSTEAESSTTTLSANSPPRPLKVVLIGAASTGKTSLRNRYHRGQAGFHQNYIATIGADFQTKRITLDDGQEVSLQLWDTAGQERFQALGAAFYRGADACILVYARNSRKTLEDVGTWFQSFVDRCPISEEESQVFPFVCIGNKSDLKHATDPDEWLDEPEAVRLLGTLCTTKTSTRGRTCDLTLDSATDVANDTVADSTEQSVKAKVTRKINRRSIEVTPDQTRSRHPRNSHHPSLSQSIYHTPASSLAHPGSWTNTNGISISHADHDEVPAAVSQAEEDAFARQLALEPELPVEPGPVPDSLLSDYEDESIVAANDAGKGPAAVEQPLISKSTPSSRYATIFGANDGIRHFTCSAKTGDGIDEAFQYLAKRAAARWAWQDREDRLRETDSMSASSAGKNKSLKVGGEQNDRKKWFGCC